MERAAIIIGVKKTGQLPELQAALDGASKMADWATMQLIPQSRIELIVDDDGPVTMSRIKATVKKFANLLSINQLIIYFSGHGMFTRGSEYWLLSDAPGDSNEAVNLAASADLARQGGFPHVVVISDACRTAASGLQFQQMMGSSMFPIPEVQPESERSVDLFFASGLGAPSNETQIPEPASPQHQWRSIYTDTLSAALKGAYPDILESDLIGTTPVRLIHPWPLKRFLSVQVPQEIVKAGLAIAASQTPDARICSDPKTWVSRIDIPADRTLVPVEGTSHKIQGLPSERSPAARNPSLSPVGMSSSSLLEQALEKDDGALRLLTRAPLPETLPISEKQVTAVARHLFDISEAVPDRFELGSGFTLLGSTFATARPIGEATQLGRFSPNAVGVFAPKPGANVLLTFKDGSSTILPAIPGFVGQIVVDRGAIRSVAYELMDATKRVDSQVSWEDRERWLGFVRRKDELRALRAMVASMSGNGTFRLDKQELGGQKKAQDLARQLQYGKTYDPSLAIYAAYAYYDLQMIDRIEEMGNILFYDLKIVPFDLALLSRAVQVHMKSSAAKTLPLFPMLSRGWSLLPVSGIALPPSLQSLYIHLRASLWTVFEREGTSMLDAAISGKEIS